MKKQGVVGLSRFEDSHARGAAVAGKRGTPLRCGEERVQHLCRGGARGVVVDRNRHDRRNARFWQKSVPRNRGAASHDDDAGFAVAARRCLIDAPAARAGDHDAARQAHLFGRLPRDVESPAAGGQRKGGEDRRALTGPCRHGFLFSPPGGSRRRGGSIRRAARISRARPRNRSSLSVRTSLSCVSQALRRTDRPTARP